jgi:hypothetical protein
VAGARCCAGWLSSGSACARPTRDEQIEDATNADRTSACVSVASAGAWTADTSSLNATLRTNATATTLLVEVFSTVVLAVIGED